MTLPALFDTIICMYTIREIAEKCNADSRYAGSVLCDEPLFARTTMRVGGNAALLLEPSDEPSLLFALDMLRENGVPYVMLGGGSNVIVSDAGYDGAVVCTRRLNGVSFADGVLTCGAGAAWGSVLFVCREHDAGGLECFSGLSGTVGGAVCINASCFGLAACDRLVSVRSVAAAGGSISTYTMTDEKRAGDWAYKSSPFQNDCVVLSAQFSLVRGFDAEKAAACVASRKEKGHFRAPSAGSVFKNDAANGIVAGKLIDECGLKGLQVGGARVADWHGNIIVNTGDATAQDVHDLVRLVQKIVGERKGIMLTCEIIFVGTFFQDGNTFKN